MPEATCSSHPAANPASYIFRCNIFHVVCLSSLHILGAVVSQVQLAPYPVCIGLERMPVTMLLCLVFREVIHAGMGVTSFFTLHAMKLKGSQDTRILSMSSSKVSPQ